MMYSVDFESAVIVTSIVIVWALALLFGKQANKFLRKRHAPKPDPEWTVRLQSTWTPPKSRYYSGSEYSCNWELYRNDVIVKDGYDTGFDKKDVEAKAIDRAWVQVWKIEDQESKTTVRREVLK